MGLQITVNNADFSSLGLGSVRWIENYIINAGITDTNQQLALRALYIKYINAGFDNKFKAFNLFFSGNATKDSFNLIKPTNDDPTYLTFLNDASNKHTTTGYAPTTTNACGISGFTIDNNQTHHIHCYNNTGATAPFSMGRHTGASDDYTSKGISNYAIGLIAGSSGNFFSVDTLKQGLNITGATNVGLFSGARNNNYIASYYNGLKVNSRTETISSVIDPSIKLTMYIGAFGKTQGGNLYNTSAGSKALFVGYGESAWTDTDETNLNTMINDFKTAMGI